jgi:hypothetical protein
MTRTREVHSPKKGTLVSVIEVQAVEANDDTEPDWVDQMGASVERTWDLAETLKEDKLLMPGARHLMEMAEVFPPGLGRRIFEAVASVLLLEAVERQRKARPKSR